MKHTAKIEELDEGYQVTLWHYGAKEYARQTLLEAIALVARHFGQYGAVIFENRHPISTVQSEPTEQP